MRFFSARETEWLQELDTIELASFHRRALAFGIDSALAAIAAAILTGSTTWVFYTIRQHIGFATPEHVDVHIGDFGHTWTHILSDIVVPILYWGLLTWRGHGQSPGKRWMRIRVVSLVHRHLSLWHSVERALGYAAAFLEGGFGFFQFFIHPYRRTVQDRIAETIVVTESSYRAMQFKPEHPLLPDTGHQPAARLADEVVPAVPPPPKPSETQTSSMISST